jgi:uncharacterized LabA/DUF88 family protein
MLLRKVMTRDGVESYVYGVTELTAQALINSASEFFPIDSRLLI